jgi:alkaline phosphatase D
MPSKTTPRAGLLQRESRRTFLSTSLKAAGGLLACRAALSAEARSAKAGPALVRQERSRPGIPYGVSSGDVTRDRAIIWSRTDRPARMLVEWSTTESFQNVRRVRGPQTTDAAGYTARVDVTGLAPGQRIFYRVQFEDLRDSRSLSVPATGSFLSAPREARDVSFAWSADTVGQGWGINTEWGGLRMYETMRSARPDFFIHCGDTIYADGPVLPEVRLPNGTLWKNVVTPAKSKVAETLDEFRGNYTYNLLDQNLCRFNAEIPQLVLWDDHEVTNNWYPGMNLDADDRYKEKNARVLAARARRAFLEYSPIRLSPGATPPIYRSCSYGPLLDVFAIDLRTYRGPNTPNRQTAPSAETVHAGPQQLAWLKRALRSSTAAWKVIASDLPIGLVVRDGAAAFEAIANADAGPPLGRELEIADLLRFLRQQRIRNVMWVTGDVHYAAAHHYDPQRARVHEFDPFWEFVAGPIHAGTFGPNALDGTFGPEVRFSSVAPGAPANRAPSEGLQFFGLTRISARTRIMTVELRNLAGEVIYTVDLDPS